MSTDITSNNTGWWYTFQTNQYIYTINDSKLGQKKRWLEKIRYFNLFHGKLHGFRLGFSTVYPLNGHFVQHLVGWSWKSPMNMLIWLDMGVSPWKNHHFPDFYEPNWKPLITRFTRKNVIIKIDESWVM